MKNLLASVRMLFFMTILTGVIYPVLVTVLAGTFFRQQALGSFISRGETIVGSELIAQKFESNRYFWSRPSATDYSTMASGGSNQGSTSADLKKLVSERSEKLKAANPDIKSEPPSLLLFASASGVDPDISNEAAEYQVARIAKARNLDLIAVRKLVADLTDPRQFGIFGESRVNVLKLNLALDTL